MNRVLFDRLLARLVATAPDRWYLQPAVPQLGAARGKLVVKEAAADATVINH